MAPVPPPKYTNNENMEMMEAIDDNSVKKSVIFDNVKPIFVTMRLLGILPVVRRGSIFIISTKWIMYSFLLLLAVAGTKLY